MNRQHILKCLQKRVQREKAIGREKVRFLLKGLSYGSSVSTWGTMIHFIDVRHWRNKNTCLQDTLQCCSPYFHCVLNWSVLGLTSWGSKNILTKLQPERELFNCHWSKHVSQSLFDILAQSLIQFFVQQAQQCPLQAYFSDVNIC